MACLQPLLLNSVGLLSASAPISLHPGSHTSLIGRRGLIEALRRNLKSNVQMPPPGVQISFRPPRCLRQEGRGGGIAKKWGGWVHLPPNEGEKTVLRMGLRMVENLSGLHESIFRSFGSPRLNSRENKNYICFCIFTGFKYTPCVPTLRPWLFGVICCCHTQLRCVVLYSRAASHD